MAENLGPDGSALATARAWLSGVIKNSGDAIEDAGVWALTHHDWRSEIMSGCLGPEGAELGHEEDVTRLDGGREFARYALLIMRNALPLRVQALGVGDPLGMIQQEIPEALDRVSVVFSDQLRPGWHCVQIGGRVGFALTMAYEDEWTVAGVQRNFNMTALLADFAALTQ